VTTIETSASQLGELLNPVVPFADDDRFSMVPILNTVRLFTIDGHLAAMATDRYQMGLQVSEIKAEGVDAVIPLGGLKAALRTFRPTRKYTPNIVVEFTSETVEFSGPSKDTWAPESRVKVNLVTTPEYPKLEELLRNAAKENTFTRVAVDSTKVSKFPSRVEVSLHEGSNKPVLFRGPGFVGLLQPLRTIEMRSDFFGSPVLDKYLRVTE
jgi:hypothetical protein